jgi:phospholipid/cholesterol/gamma-HCH transport system substrate-binding protein
MVDLVPVQQVPKECFALAQALNARQLPLTDQLRRLLGLPPGTASPSGRVPPGTSGIPAAPAVPGVPAVPGGPNPGDSGDPTLGGILPLPGGH